MVWWCGCHLLFFHCEFHDPNWLSSSFSGGSWLNGDFFAPLGLNNAGDYRWTNVSMESSSIGPNPGVFHHFLCGYPAMDGLNWVWIHIYTRKIHLAMDDLGVKSTINHQISWNVEILSPRVMWGHESKPWKPVENGEEWCISGRNHGFHGVSWDCFAHVWSSRRKVVHEWCGRLILRSILSLRNRWNRNLPTVPSGEFLVGSQMDWPTKNTRNSDEFTDMGIFWKGHG